MLDSWGIVLLEKLLNSIFFFKEEKLPRLFRRKFWFSFSFFQVQLFVCLPTRVEVCVWLPPYYVCGHLSDLWLVLVNPFWRFPLWRNNKKIHFQKVFPHTHTQSSLKYENFWGWWGFILWTLSGFAWLLRSFSLAHSRMAPDLKNTASLSPTLQCICRLCTAERCVDSGTNVIFFLLFFVAVKLKCEWRSECVWERERERELWRMR